MNFKIHFKWILIPIPIGTQNNLEDSKLNILRVMKLAIILMLAFSFTTFGKTFSQVTISFEKASLREVLTEIRKQTGYSFMYGSTIFKEAEPVSIKLTNVSLEETLKNLFENQPFDYEIKGKTIIVEPKRTNDKSILKEGKTQQKIIRGQVFDEQGNFLRNATVQVKGGNQLTTTDEQGKFTISNVDQNAHLQISYLGYKTKVVLVRNDLIIILSKISSLLDDAEVAVNTGFQTLPKERATGSFVKVNNELLNRNPSSKVIDRLEGVVSGMMFNGNYVAHENSSRFNIRGLSTIFADQKPLIIVDNFPFDGDISNLNPNDVLDISILRDAAASSIWGAKSGNGVIVITTKKGAFNNPLNISFNSNLSLSAKPDIYYGQNFLNSSSFIDAEKFLFDKGYYNNSINSNSKPVISPVVELLTQAKAGLLSEIEAQNLIESFRNYDFRNDQSKYLYQNTTSQQYSLNLNGGTDRASYYISVGYDHLPSILIGNANQRISLTSNTVFKPFKQLEATFGLMHILGDAENNNGGKLTTIGKANYYPYAQLVDELGNTLSLPKDYRLNYIQNLNNPNLLDWQYRPLDELGLANNTTKSTHTRLNTSLKYKLISELSLEARYQLEKQNTSIYNLNSENSYYTRNLVNLYTQVGLDGTYKYPVPRGGILDQNKSELTGQSIRVQFNFDKSFDVNHEISAIGGIDGKEVITDINSWNLYGYNDKIGTTIPVDYQNSFAKYNNLAFGGKIPYLNYVNKFSDIYFSYFTNAAYTYNNRFIFSGSARIDQSNLFGVHTNQKSVPLWSAGGAWILSKENFLKGEWIDFLKLRTSYGYNGNIDKTVSSFATGVFISAASLTGLPYVLLQTPPNPELRWEKIAMFNIGTDFKFFKGILEGSIEYYHKKGTDMFSYASLDPSTGMDRFKGNIADIKGEGFDLDLNISLGNKLKWIGNILFSMSKDKVIKYERTTTLSSYLQSASGELGASESFTPIVNQPIFGVYSYPWGGLDSQNGDPLLLMEGNLNKEYSKLFTSTDLSNLIYHGYARPPYFGAIKNTFSFKNASLSFNLTYKLGYYFRRPSVNYSLLASQWKMHSDYDLRWKQSGDEKFTDVPSITYPLNSSRDNFYTNSEILVEKGDHFRLQDIRLSYSVPINSLGRNRHINMFVYANNLAVIWKNTSTRIDPDFVFAQYRNPRSITIGLQISI